MPSGLDQAGLKSMQRLKNTERFGWARRNRTFQSTEGSARGAPGTQAFLHCGKPEAANRLNNFNATITGLLNSRRPAPKMTLTGAKSHEQESPNCVT